MSNEAKYTERDMVLAQRDAYLLGVRDRERYGRSGPDGYVETYDGYTRPKGDAAMLAFPLPRVTRPRVVRDPTEPGVFWKVECDGSGVYAVNEDGVMYEGGLHAGIVNADRIRLFADLLANPTETVEDEG